MIIILQGIADYKREIPVAVKTLSFKNQHLLDKFMEEINLMKKFAHPNIVGLLGMYPIMIIPALVYMYYLALRLEYMYNTLCKATIMYMYVHAFILVASSPVSSIMQH